MSNLAWQPSCDISMLKIRAELLQNIRQFFFDRNVLEVETPILSTETITDPNLASLATKIFDQTLYLQTSPEFYMKRLLATGSGSIFQVGKAFRADEAGRFHHPEFTMLEWYRIDFTDKELMTEIEELLKYLLNCHSAKYYSYQNIFQTLLFIDPLTATVTELQKAAAEQKILVNELDAQDKDLWLNLLFSHCIEPKLVEANQPYFIYDFPISQAALAKPSADDPRVARRFELYLHGIELANGFDELTDADEQRLRFAHDLNKRQAQQLPITPMPELLLAALNQGLPACAGVALGLDRLLMIKAKAKSIQEVLSFVV